MSTHPLGSLAVAMVVAVAAFFGPGVAQDTTHSHQVTTAEAIQWKTLRPGAEMAVISGNPDQEGSSFVLRLRYKDKARVPPHWHPKDEHITVFTGTFRLGMGESGDESTTTPLGPGAYAFVTANMKHYAWADKETVIQVHGLGPFVINYVNPADDPKNAKK